jgi:hypothetical protein
MIVTLHALVTFPRLWRILQDDVEVEVDEGRVHVNIFEYRVTVQASYVLYNGVDVMVDHPWKVEQVADFRILMS